MAKILVTGGAGYIGSHTLVELLSLNHDILVVDNFSNSSPDVLKRVEEISGSHVELASIDICDKANLNQAVKQFEPEIVIHFAGLKAVGDSMKYPLDYFEVNIGGTVNLLKAMDLVNCNYIVFSSSATVYGKPQYLPYDEKHPTFPESVYGHTKLQAENIIKAWQVANQNASAVSLRYFNPIGAHTSGLIGEDPQGIPNNLAPYIEQVAAGLLEKVSVFGNDYDTPDGTGMRDYVHVSDLARAHCDAMEYITTRNTFEKINIGTGKDYSVLELINSYIRSTNKKIPFTFSERREGDLARFYASNDMAKEKLGWCAKLDIDEMCASSWNWRQKNPNGYDS